MTWLWNPTGLLSSPGKIAERKSYTIRARVGTGEAMWRPSKASCPARCPPSAAPIPYMSTFAVAPKEGQPLLHCTEALSLSAEKKRCCMQFPRLSVLA